MSDALQDLLNDPSELVALREQVFLYRRALNDIVLQEYCWHKLDGHAAAFSIAAIAREALGMGRHPDAGPSDLERFEATLRAIYRAKTATPDELRAMAGDALLGPVLAAERAA